MNQVNNTIKECLIVFHYKQHGHTRMITHSLIWTRLTGKIWAVMRNTVKHNHNQIIKAYEKHSI